MIQNQNQYRNTKNQLNQFEQSLVELDRNPDRLSPWLLAAQKAGLQVWIDRLQAQIEENVSINSSSRSVFLNIL